MDKFNEYLKSKSESENKDFILPKSFEHKLEETLENLDKQEQSKSTIWYRNKSFFNIAAGFTFVFLVGLSIKYGVNSNKIGFVAKNSENQNIQYSGDILDVASHNNSESRSINEGDLADDGIQEYALKKALSDSFINYNNITKVIIKETFESNTYKAIDKKNDIENVIGFINNISKEEINKQTLDDWDFLIQTNGVDSNHSIIVRNDIMNIDNKWYKINGEEVNKLKSMYNDLNYNENNIGYCDY